MVSTDDTNNGKPTSGAFEPPPGGSPDSGQTGAEDTVVVNDLSAQLEAVAVERDRLAAQNEELQSTLLRRQADFENYRKRVEREKGELVEYGAMQVMRELVPVLDDLERARAAAPADLDTDSEYARGVAMIYQRLFDILSKLGLEPLESAGKPFDPTVHHAVERVPTESVEEGTVLEEWQRGYNFKGKLLREAMVRVAVKPSASAE
jgi:molecular chaperone GrpE